MKIFLFFAEFGIGLMLASIASLAYAQPVPWFDAPVIDGPAGVFTCITTPHPAHGAVITCDPSKMAALPPAARTFLILHEHGHVAQIHLGKTLFVPNMEADADCYAAKFMRTDPVQFNAAILWLKTVLGTGGGGSLHGTGLRVADFAIKCASTPP